MGLRIPLLGDVVERSLNNFFQRLGEFIGLHPLPFLVIPLLVTVLLSTGMFKGRIEQDLNKLYTPKGAPSQFEKIAREEFLRPTSSGGTVILKWVHVLFYVKDPVDGDNNVLTTNRSNYLLNFHHHVTKELNYTYDGRTKNFGREMCDKSVWCREYSNKAVVVFLNIATNQKLLRNPNLRYRYPVMDAFGIKFFLGYNIFGVPEVPEDHNQSSITLDAAVVRLMYTVDIHAANKSAQEFDAFQSAFTSYVDSINGDHGMRLFLFTPTLIGHEIERNATACFPFLALTFILLIVFTVVSTLTSSRVTSKPWEALLGAWACAMAIGSTVGLMFYCGLAINATVSVMPFLAFAIGIDDTFLALSAWHATDPSLPPHKRLSMSLRESGTAITVTSLTDVALFGLCAISSTPAITVFSIFTAVAMAFDYIYQLTFFTAVLAYAGRREAKKLHSCIPCWPSSQPIESAPPNTDIDLQAQFVQKKLMGISDSELMPSRIIRTKYAPALNKPVVKICVFLLYVFYLAISFYGCIQMKVFITASRTILDDSPVQEFLQIEQKYLTEYIQADIFIRKAPDFRNESEQATFENLLKDIEATKYSRGNESTRCFYREFQNYIQYIDHTPDQFYDNIREFLDVYVHSVYQGSIHWTTPDGKRTYKDDPNGTITEFTFSSGFGAPSWEAKVDMLRTWRNISKHYPKYDMVIYEGGSCFTDQYDTLEDETIQQVGIALIGMTLMAAFFIPSLSSIFWVGWTLLSMDFGVIGLLVLWGCDLDTSVMMNIVMSLDFAVEYAAHVCHRYYVSKEGVGSDKLVDTLGAIGWPVIQGAMAAIIAVLPLVFVHSYIVRVFFRTVILVVGIGIVHAMVFLPVFVSSVSQKRYLPSRSVARTRMELKNQVKQKKQEETG